MNNCTVEGDRSGDGGLWWGGSEGDKSWNGQSDSGGYNGGRLQIIDFVDGCSGTGGYEGDNWSSGKCGDCWSGKVV